MGSIHFCALFALYSGYLLALVAGSGEYCHGWSDGQGDWHPGFQCPERYDGAEATLCCGSCELRYCCSVLDNRLDQGVCSNDNYMQQEADSHTRTASVPMYLPFLIVGSIFVAFIIVGSFIAVCCCRCLKPKEEENQQSVPSQSRLLELVPPPSVRSPSRHSTSSTDSINLYMNVPANFPVMGCHQAQQFLPPQSTANPFLPPHYLSYGIPADHTLVMAPPFVDRPGYGQPPPIPYSHGAIHGDQLMYPAVTL
uniref:Shisa family member 2a n=1 Tax=Callorhinchus milii TaxID=7868 RepID=A0A4W3J8T3_CALMI